LQKFRPDNRVIAGRDRQPVRPAVSGAVTGR